MCGIAGFAGEGDRDILTRMTAQLLHRGPDGSGEYCDEASRVFLGHRRLSIIDIAGGVQPMWNEDRTVGVVFNGEIYNHHELRAELKARGHTFATDHSDTEVLVHGYEEWGCDLPLRLSGMFAFALYDATRSRLFLARDRFGKKPLFYAQRGHFLAFASELTALLQHPLVARDIDVQGVRKFFAHNFFPTPYTLYRAVRTLPAAHFAEFDLRSCALRIEPYWRFRIEPEEPRGSEQDLAEELRQALDNATRRRLESDVPLGVLLSGGIDSSAIIALAARNMPAERLNSFSMGFVESTFDESEYARAMAAAVGCRHHHTTCNLESARDEIGDLLMRLGEPIGDSSVLPTYLVSSFARRSVTVALGGDGGDELFAGYDPVEALKLSRLYQQFVPKALHPAIRAAAARLPKSDRNMSFDFKVNRWLRGLSARPAMWNPLWMSALEPDEIRDLFASPVDVEDLYSEAIAIWDDASSHNDIDRTLEFFTIMYLTDDILVKVDRASMLASLEVRAPFLDTEVVEFARRLPHRFKFRSGVRKYILKRALEGLVPDRILNRPKKGFGIPLARWLRTLPQPAGSLQFLDTEWLRGRWQRHRVGREDCRFGLWCWLALDRHNARLASDAATAAA